MKKSKGKRAEAALTLDQARELFKELYPLLREIEPADDPYDLFWQGPFWVDGKGLWHPTWFALKRGLVTGSIRLRAGSPMMEGDIRTGEVKWIDVDQPGWPRGVEYWPEALPQIHRTLSEALKDIGAHNRRVEEDMPLESRWGKVARRFTWTDEEQPMPAAQIAAAQKAAESARARPPLPELSAGEYLRIAGIAYDAAYPEERKLSLEEKHRRHADKRHGGMLDLPHGDAAAFREWLTSRRWEGAHPFEIAYGIPHGIMLRPALVEGGYRFSFAVSDELYYKNAMLMAIAMDEAGIPFDFSQVDRLSRVLEGSDEVEVGPDRGQIPLERLRRDRPDAIAHITWSPVPQLAPVTPEGRARIAWVEEHGTLRGFKAEGAEEKT